MTTRIEIVDGHRRWTVEQKLVILRDALVRIALFVGPTDDICLGMARSIHGAGIHIWAASTLSRSKPRCHNEIGDLHKPVHVHS